MLLGKCWTYTRVLFCAVIDECSSVCHYNTANFFVNLRMSDIRLENFNKNLSYFYPILIGS